MFKRLPMLGMLSILVLPGCSTTAPISARGSPVKAVPCVNLPVITLHTPKDMASGQAWFSGKLPDPSNIYDTPDTVLQIRRNNAARNAICGP